MSEQEETIERLIFENAALDSQVRSLSAALHQSEIKNRQAQVLLSEAQALLKSWERLGQAFARIASSATLGEAAERLHGK